MFHYFIKNKKYEVESDFHLIHTHLWQGYRLFSHSHLSWKPTRICGGSAHHRK